MALYVGCTLKPVENWQAILPAPQAPSNYKDPAKIQAYIQEKLADLMAGKAAEHALSGSIDRAAIVIDGPDEYNVLELTGGVALVEKLGELCGPAPRPIVAGYKLSRNLRLAAIDALAVGKLPYAALWMLHADPLVRYGFDYYDPISIIFGSSDEDKIDVYGVMRRLGIEADLTTARGLAEFAKKVAERIA